MLPAMRILSVQFLLTCLLNCAFAQSVPPAAFFPFTTPSGTVIAAGGGAVPEEIFALITQQISAEAPLLILPDAAEDPVAASAAAEELLRAAGIEHLFGRKESLSPQLRQQILQQTLTVGAVWICGGQQSRLAEVWKDSELPARLRDVIRRGGVVAGTSAGAAIMTKTMIASGTDLPVMGTGWDLLPDVIIDQHFTERNRLIRSQLALQDNPGHVGIGIDENTAVVIQGRRLIATGTGTVTVMLAASADLPAATTTLAARDSADLVQLRRAARQRTTAATRKTALPDPLVPHGSLIIIGGGGMPEEIVERFISLAGGPQAKIIVLPTAYPPEQTDTRLPRFLQDAEISKVTVLPQRGPEQIASEEFRMALKEATGIWFGGGRQWNFLDAYEATEAPALFRDVLTRGGVIAGSSAGATIQGELLVRGHPLGNTIMIAEGYEQGFAYLPGSAIDQHFTQRNRQPDLLPVIRDYPHLLGVGIDEATALVVAGNTAEVIGEHAVHLLTRHAIADLPEAAALDPLDAAMLYRTIPSGDSIDLRDFYPDH